MMDCPDCKVKGDKIQRFSAKIYIFQCPVCLRTFRNKKGGLIFSDDGEPDSAMPINFDNISYLVGDLEAAFDFMEMSEFE